MSELRAREREAERLIVVAMEKLAAHYSRVDFMELVRRTI